VRQPPPILGVSHVAVIPICATPRRACPWTGAL